MSFSGVSYLKLWALRILVLPVSLLFGLIDYPSWILVSGFDTESPVPLVAFLLISVPIDTFFILIGFNTSNEATTAAYLFMIYGSFIALIAFRFYGGADEEPLPFDHNPGIKGLGLGLVLGLVVLLMNIVAVAAISGLSLLPSGFGGLRGINYNSLLFVPQFFSTSQVGHSSVFDNSVFEVILTAPGEEGLKAAMIYGMYMLSGSELLSVGFSVGIWASFHLILVQFSYPEVGLAVVSGLIWYAGWKKTGSLLTSVASHGLYDGLIVILAGIGSIGVISVASMVSLFIVVAVVVALAVTMIVIMRRRS